MEKEQEIKSATDKDLESLIEWLLASYDFDRTYCVRWTTHVINITCRHKYRLSSTFVISCSAGYLGVHVSLVKASAHWDECKTICTKSVNTVDAAKMVHNWILEQAWKTDEYLSVANNEGDIDDMFRTARCGGWRPDTEDGRPVTDDADGSSTPSDRKPKGI